MTGHITGYIPVPYRTVSPQGRILSLSSSPKAVERQHWDDLSFVQGNHAFRIDTTYLGLLIPFFSVILLVLVDRGYTLYVIETSTTTIYYLIIYTTMPGKTTTTPRITKFTNCRILKGRELVEQDLWIDSLSGKILRDQVAFYELHLSPDEVIDLGGRILAPGLIDVQLNGAQGFDFSVPQVSREKYEDGLRMVNKGLARTGVTSYLPTLVSSTPEVYWKVCLPVFPSVLYSIC